MPMLEGWLPWAVKLLIVLVFIWLSRSPDRSQEDGDAIRVQVVVLGDIGRSPRMQYHALSIAKHGGQVDFIGYQESALHSQIEAAANIHIYPLTPFPEFLKTKSKRLFLLLGPLKVLFQIWTLWLTLQFRTKQPRWVLVQNPPSIPTLLIALIACRSRTSRFVIDWHNFGYSILALRLGTTHPLVRLSSVYEQVLARFADGHFCVTDAMARVLRRTYNISVPIRPLHDRPAASFQILGETQRLAFLARLPEFFIDQHARKEKEATRRQRNPSDSYKGEGGELKELRNGSSCMETEIRKITELVETVKSESTKLLVSSTSWTADEDFSLLLTALTGYSERAHMNTSLALPKLLVIITGKGPLKAQFEAQVTALNEQDLLGHAIIKTIFFDDFDDYASLLGSADLGVSLHTSSSGVDLPMKAVDMFGAGLPVVGWGEFEAWSELVKEGINGMAFRSAAELQEILETLFEPNQKMLRRLRKGAMEEGKRRWDDEWDPVAGQLFGLVEGKPQRY